MPRDGAGDGGAAELRPLVIELVRIDAGPPAMAVLMAYCPRCKHKTREVALVARDTLNVQVHWCSG